MIILRMLKHYVQKNRGSEVCVVQLTVPMCLTDGIQLMTMSSQSLSLQKQSANPNRSQIKNMEKEMTADGSICSTWSARTGGVSDGDPYTIGKLYIRTISNYKNKLSPYSRKRVTGSGTGAICLLGSKELFLRIHCKYWDASFQTIPN